MPYATLAKAWAQLAVSKKRQKAEVKWLDWGDATEEDHDGEPSMDALKLNCDLIYCMFSELQSLDVVLSGPLRKADP